MFGKTEKEKQEDNKEADVEYADYEICRKSKVGEYLQTGQEFFVADMKKKKIYSSNDLRPVSYTHLDVYKRQAPPIMKERRA